MIFNKPIFTGSRDRVKNIQYILDLIDNHKSFLGKYKVNKDYYLGNHSILYKTIQDTSKPNNKIVTNLPEFVTSIRVGYFSGEPIVFNTDNEELDIKLTDILESADFNDINTSLDEIASIYGHAYLMMWIDEEGATKFSAESPENCFIVYSNTLDKTPIAGVRYLEYQDEKDTITDIYLYLDNEIITIRKSGDSHQIIDSQPNYFGGIPMIEFIENNSRKGCFEDAISIVDAIESVLSGTVNELEYFDNAYLHLKNLSATTNEDIQEMKNNRVLLTEDEGQAEFLTKTVNDAYIQNTLDRLTNDFHKLTKTPNISDESFGNNTSGVSLKFKLFPLEKSMALKEQKWRRSLNMMLKLIINRLNMLGGNFNSKEVKLTFTRALPTNQLEQSQMVAQLAGLVSNETLISQLDFIEKPKDELEKLKNEKSASLDTYNFEEVV